MVLDDLSKLGTRTFYSVVASEGVAAIYEFRQGPQGGPEAVAPDAGRLSSQLSGCVAVEPARHW